MYMYNVYVYVYEYVYVYVHVYNISTYIVRSQSSLKSTSLIGAEISWDSENLKAEWKGRT